MHTLEWDYTELANAYRFRPDYADAAIDLIAERLRQTDAAPVVDLGAGMGHLTKKLAARYTDVVALEPNPQMRALGMRELRELANIQWVEGIMEQTGFADGAFRLASCGSSFGVTDRAATLREVGRILRPGGYFVALWNHRDLDDPLQRKIEEYIKSELPAYSYGLRREDQSAVISASGLFSDIAAFSFPVLHRVPLEEWLRAWGSHATLQRQAGERFPELIAGIDQIVRRRCRDRVEVPYTTQGWLACHTGDPAP